MKNIKAYRAGKQNQSIWLEIGEMCNHLTPEEAEEVITQLLGTLPYYSACLKEIWDARQRPRGVVYSLSEAVNGEIVASGYYGVVKINNTIQATGITCHTPREAMDSVVASYGYLVEFDSHIRRDESSYAAADKAAMIQQIERLAADAGMSTAAFVRKMREGN